MNKSGKKKERVTGQPVPAPREVDRRQPAPVDEMRRQLGWELAAVARTHGKGGSR